MVPAMDAAKLTLSILSYTQYLATVATAAQKTFNDNVRSFVQAHANLKARVEEIAHLKEHFSKKTPGLEETLIPQLKQAQWEAKLAKNHLTHAEAKVRDLRGS